MPKLKLTKTAAESAAPEAKEYELRDTVRPGFLLKVTPLGRKMFMVAYTPLTVSAESQRSAASARSQSNRLASSRKTGWRRSGAAATRAPSAALPARHRP